MPDQWGLGISSNAGGGLDDDLGDNVDRLQLAVPIRQTVLGPVVVVPYYDINSSGVVSQNLGGTGQPFSLDKADARTTLGLKLARLDTDDELQRKIAAGKTSWNYGVRYGYHSQGWRFGTATGVPGTPSTAEAVDQVKIALSYHAVDLWGRMKSKRWRVEMADKTTRVVEARGFRVEHGALGVDAYGILTLVLTGRRRECLVGDVIAVFPLERIVQPIALDVFSSGERKEGHITLQPGVPHEARRAQCDAG